MNTIRAGVICWIGTAVFFVGQAIAQAWVRAPYSMIDNYVSDLGAVDCGSVSVGIYRAQVCSPLHGFMNAGFVLTGVGIVLGTLLLRPLWPTGRWRTAATVLLVLGGVGKIIAGMSPEDLCPVAHLGGAVFSGPVATIGVLVLARAVGAEHRVLARILLGCGLVGVAGLLLSAAASQGIGLGVGITERIAAYPTIIATTLAGGWLLIKLD
ncbi:DUF998 domain-containing protein [Microlunatus soli]|uniref:DUF998 domain-containing protein n=1 Tax=Microlunatus soli TaxID=630515 RepID=A0A1H1WG16_9ACTN|nr:DUF998 domain-containing protein [Microlunatus soli]SDS95571.1 Protein of unknown function [Microlunatus soli]